MPVRPLPPNPDLAHLSDQARDLVQQHASRLPSAARRLREFHPQLSDLPDAAIFDATLTFADAQLAVAQESGFRSWERLKRRVESPTRFDDLSLPHHERIEDPTFRHAVDLIDTGQTSALEALLESNPELVHQHVLFEGGNYFRTPTLLEFVAENPIRHGKLPANIVEIVRVILEVSPDVAARNEALMPLDGKWCAGRLVDRRRRTPRDRLSCGQGTRGPRVAQGGARRRHHRRS